MKINRSLLPLLCVSQLLTVMWWLGVGGISAAETSVTVARETRDISGWQVHISKHLLKGNPEPTARAIAGLTTMLDSIIRLVPAPAVAELRKVPLYVSPAYKAGRSGAEFHPDAGWLRDNGRDPVMAQGVEFSGVDDFEAEMRRMPNFALHELAHAYHFRTLKNGFGNTEIQTAYQRAKAAGSYDRVERSYGEGNGRPNTFERAYAMTNAMEYFAEATEAYFARNDFFPFTRDELKQHDPDMFALVEKLWGVSTPTAAPDAGQRKKRAGFSYPPDLKGASVQVYRQTSGTDLKVWIFTPKNTAEKRPAIVFFFGGGWSSGSPAQFERQCRHFAERGMVAITADYRVATRQQAKPADCVADAKACLRWVRENAVRLGVDPDRIVAAGGSAGGHLAAATATVPGFEPDASSEKISAKPNALVLFNPCLVTAPLEGVDFKGFSSNFTAEKLGAERTALSPIHHIKPGLPPMLILHGTADSTVPFSTVEAFSGRMAKAGNRCELKPFEGQPHGFFNGPGYEETLKAADDFLVSLHYLPPANGR